MTEQTRIALDQAACIQMQSNIGETIAHNICTGTTAAVPWGSADWLGFAALCGLGGVFAVLFGGLAVLVWSEFR